MFSLVQIQTKTAIIRCILNTSTGRCAIVGILAKPDVFTEVKLSLSLGLGCSMLQTPSSWVERSEAGQDRSAIFMVKNP